VRWWRSSRFLAERGMGITVGVNLEVQEWLSLIAPGGEAPRFITLERRWERNDGGALVAMVAHTGDPDLPIVTWENPFRPARKGTASSGTTTRSAWPAVCSAWWKRCATACEPSYGAHQARLDQELTLAIRISSQARRRADIPATRPDRADVVSCER
jgi:hypothetical protein